MVDRSYTVAPHPGRERKAECPRQALLTVTHIPGYKQTRGLMAEVDPEIHVAISDGVLPREVSEATVLPGRRKVRIAIASVASPSCGLGTRVYEAFAAEACELGYSLESDSSLSVYSRGFWDKQVRKGRAVVVPHPGGSPSYRIDNPCEHRGNLSGVPAQPCTHPKKLRALTKRVRACLSRPEARELLRPEYRGHSGHPLTGHCAVASEALWVAAARDLGYKHRQAKLPDGTNHWWLVSPSGCILDPTSAQFSSKDLQRIYAAGKGRGPQGVRRSGAKVIPSPRAKWVLERL